MARAIETKPIQGILGKIPVHVLAKAIQLWTYNIVMQVILGTMAAKKTGIKLGSLASAAGVPPI